MNQHRPLGALDPAYLNRLGIVSAQPPDRLDAAITGRTAALEPLPELRRPGLVPKSS